MSDSEELQDIILYRINKGVPIFIRQGVRERKWMDETKDKYAYRCLPLTIANQHGYEISAAKSIKMIWNGGNSVNDIYIETGLPNGTVSSHFGHGIVTFHPNLLMRTPKNVNLYVSGVPNMPKRGISPLTGIVETDWNPATFTMNWQITEPYKEIEFEAFEPFCFFYPIQRGYAEQFRAIVRPIEGDQEEYNKYHEWSNSRNVFNKGTANTATSDGWQKNYFQGTYLDGSKCPIDHQTKIKLKEPKIYDDTE